MNLVHDALLALLLLAAYIWVAGIVPALPL